MAYLTTTFYNNTCTIAQAKNLKAHKKSKHIQWNYHFLKEFVEIGEILIEKTLSAKNVADPLIGF